jgi:TetR/AcrR family transcriptional regulator, cholesterol catabolism regulator
MRRSADRTHDVPTQIKNPELVKRRRRQIVDAAVQLFIEKGFHKTTTREIAKAAGFSIGSLYEYVASKEDVLYLVCDAIHAEVERGVGRGPEADHPGPRGPGRGDPGILFWSATACATIFCSSTRKPSPCRPQWRKKVLENEINITGIFIKVLTRLVDSGIFPRLDERSIELAAHNISVLGHMWTFRRWFLARHYSIDDYIELQTDFILGISTGGDK